MTNYERAVYQLRIEIGGHICAGRGDPVGKSECLSIADTIAKRYRLRAKNRRKLRSEARRLAT